MRYEHVAQHTVPVLSFRALNHGRPLFPLVFALSLSLGQGLDLCHRQFLFRVLIYLFFTAIVFSLPLSVGLGIETSVLKHFAAIEW